MDADDADGPAGGGVHGGVAAAILACIVLLVAALRRDSGAPWSIENLAMILVPPLAFGGLLLLARRTAVESSGVWSVVSRVLLGLTWILFVLALVLVPVGLAGEWMDAGIG